MKAQPGALYRPDQRLTQVAGNFEPSWPSRLRHFFRQKYVFWNILLGVYGPVSRIIELWKISLWPGMQQAQGVSSGNCRDTMRGGGGSSEGLKHATDGGLKG